MLLNFALITRISIVSNLHELATTCMNVTEAQNFSLGDTRGKFYYVRR